MAAGLPEAGITVAPAATSDASDAEETSAASAGEAETNGDAVMAEEPVDLDIMTEVAAEPELPAAPAKPAKKTKAAKAVKPAETDEEPIELIIEEPTLF